MKLARHNRDAFILTVLIAGFLAWSVWKDQQADKQNELLDDELTALLTALIA